MFTDNFEKAISEIMAFFNDSKNGTAINEK
jgi:hypothetical protein